jgi:hypothetical protein
MQLGIDVRTLVRRGFLARLLEYLDRENPLAEIRHPSDDANCETCEDRIGQPFTHRSDGVRTVSSDGVAELYPVVGRRGSGSVDEVIERGSITHSAAGSRLP